MIPRGMSTRYPRTSRRVATTVDPAASLAQVHIYNVTARPGAWTSRINGVELFSTVGSRNALGTENPLLRAQPGQGYPHATQPMVPALR
jgi:hypothetical protein